MWDAIAPVDNNYDPIIYEGPPVAVAVILNAGPGTIQILAWNTKSSNQNADIVMEMRPGNIRSISGHLLRSHLLHGSFSAIAWRLLV